MKTFLSILFLASAFGQSVPSMVAFVPFGPWPICQTDGAGSLPIFFGNVNYCATLTRGSEPDLLSIKSSNPLTTDFLYILTGSDSTAVVKTVTGNFKRKDNAAGFSSTIVTAGMTSARVTIVEYSYDPAAGSFLMLQNSTHLFTDKSAVEGRPR
jgi:hypothetical protein